MKWFRVVVPDARSCFEHGDQGGTFSGTALITVVGSAVLSVVAQPEFLANVEKQGRHLRHQLQALSQEFGLGEVRGEGLLVALEIPACNAAQIAAEALSQGLLINSTRANVLRFMPALNVCKSEIDEMAIRLRLTLQKTGVH